MPIAERLHRIKKLKQRLGGVHMIYTEPFYKPLMKIFENVSGGQITWLAWEKLISRADEVSTGKAQLSFRFDASGNLNLN